MDNERGSQLFQRLWPSIDSALSVEPRGTRLQFISDVLQLFLKHGIDLSDMLEMDEDIKVCANEVGIVIVDRERSSAAAFVWDTTHMDDPQPVEYELLGGPYDGTTICMTSDLMEMPPGLVTLTPYGQNSRLDSDVCYELKAITERDRHGNPTGEYLAYRQRSTVAEK